MINHIKRFGKVYVIIKMYFMMIMFVNNAVNLFYNNIYSRVTFSKSIL